MRGWGSKGAGTPAHRSAPGVQGKRNPQGHASCASCVATAPTRDLGRGLVDGVDEVAHLQRTAHAAGRAGAGRAERRVRRRAPRCTPAQRARQQRAHISKQPHTVRGRRAPAHSSCPRAAPPARAAAASRRSCACQTATRRTCLDRRGGWVGWGGVEVRGGRAGGVGVQQVLMLVCDGGSGHSWGIGKLSGGAAPPPIPPSHSIPLGSVRPPPTRREHPLLGVVHAVGVVQQVEGGQLLVVRRLRHHLQRARPGAAARAAGSEQGPKLRSGILRSACSPPCFPSPRKAGSLARAQTHARPSPLPPTSPPHTPTDTTHFEVQVDAADARLVAGQREGVHFLLRWVWVRWREGRREQE